MSKIINKIRESIIAQPLFDYGLVTIAVLLVLLPVSPLNFQLAFKDPGVFLYAGWRILHGEVPYRDIWDQKPPVIFYLNALGLAVARGSRWGVWAIELISLFVAALIGYKIIQKLLGRTAAIISLYLWLLNLFFILRGGNYTTEYTLPLQFGCILLTINQNGRTNTRYHNLLIGILCGIAFFTKQNTIGVGGAVFLYMLIEAISSREYKKYFMNIWWMTMGGLIVAIIVILVFLLQGALQQFWDAAFFYNTIYVTQNSLADHIEALRIGISIFSIGDFSSLAIIGWVIGLILLVLKKFKPPLKTLILLTLLDFPIEIVFVGLPGYPYTHYYMTLLPACSILAGVVVWAVTTLVNKMQWLSTKRVIWESVVAAVILGLITRAEFISYYDSVISLRIFRNNPIIAYIDQNTNKNDYVLMWGGQTVINFFSQRASPSRFNYLYPLYTPGYLDEQKTNEFLNDIYNKKPRLIIDTLDGYTPMDKFGYLPSQNQRWRNYLQENYVIVGRMNGTNTYIIYKRK